jgi:hypothetical protein
MTQEKLFRKLAKFVKKHDLEYLVVERNGRLVTVRFLVDDEKEV